MADTRYTTKMMERKPYRVWGDWNLWNSAVATHYSHTVIWDAMNYKKRKWEKRKFDAKKFKLKRMEAFPKEWNADIEFHRWQTAWIFIPSKAWKGGGGKNKNPSKKWKKFLVMQFVQTWNRDTKKQFRINLWPFVTWERKKNSHSEF